MPKRIVILGDIHDHQQRLGIVLGWLSDRPADLALLVGDLGLDPPWSAEGRRLARHDHDESVRRVVQRVRETLGCPVVFVPGNHDLADPPADTGGVNADGRVVEIAGIRIAGLGGSGPAIFGFPYEWSDRAAEQALEALLAGRREPLDVLLCHAPPAGTGLDRTARGDHVGSGAVGRWISRACPRLFACGHIHESPGVEWRDGVPCLNAGSLGEPYGQEIGWAVDWDAGPARIVSLHRDAAGGMRRRVWHPAGA